MGNMALNNIKEQHINSYKTAIKELIKNNTNSLIDEDVLPLFRKPPLDSMDIIRCKFLESAKSNNVILNSDILDNKMERYRRKIINECNNIKKFRLEELLKIVDDYEIKNKSNVVKINKKDFFSLNKSIKKSFKDILLIALENNIIKGIDSIFLEGIDNDVKNKIIVDITKFIKNIYYKQLLDNISIKMMVKDNILINGVKEQGERYIFTMNNSRLFNDNIK